MKKILVRFLFKLLIRSYTEVLKKETGSAEILADKLIGVILSNLSPDKRLLFLTELMNTETKTSKAIASKLTWRLKDLLAKERVPFLIDLISKNTKTGQIIVSRSVYHLTDLPEEKRKLFQEKLKITENSTAYLLNGRILN